MKSSNAAKMRRLLKWKRAQTYGMRISIPCPDFKLDFTCSQVILYAQNLRASHIHSLVNCGAFTPEGEFLNLPEFDMDSLLVAWQEAVFALYLAEGKIEPEVMENMRSWEHSGFSVDQSVLLDAGDRSGIERLVQYMVRCPFSRAPSRSDGRRLVKVTDTGQVAYKAEKDACQVFPDPQADNLEAGANWTEIHSTIIKS